MYTRKELALIVRQSKDETLKTWYRVWMHFSGMFNLLNKPAFINDACIEMMQEAQSNASWLIFMESEH